MYHFFINPDQVHGSEAVITGTDVNHIKNVLRMKNGESVLLSDGQKNYSCTIAAVEDMQVIVHIESSEEKSTELAAKIYLFQGLPKGDKMETIIQKCVELGVYEIIPVEMKRCIVRLDEKKAQAKVKRWQMIAESAAKQSKRSIIPVINKVTGYKEALKTAQNMNHVIIPYECAADMEFTRNAVKSIKPGDSAAVFIGPEGGFDEEEIKLAADAGAKIVTLGKRILRTETAGMALLSMMVYELD